MKEVRAMYESWLADDTIVEHYGGDQVAVQKDFIQCIQQEIGSDFIVLTQAELDKRLSDHYNSMEGLW
jgi:hypothetical protein